MCKKIWMVTKLNLKNIMAAYVITAIALVGQSTTYILNVFMYPQWDMSHNVSVSLSWSLWLLPVLAACIIPVRNFRRIINLGGKRDNFFWGSLETYAILAMGASLGVTILHYALDIPYVGLGKYGSMWTPANVFGWANHGILAEIYQQFAFLLLFACFVHTLAATQDKWYGWVADVLLVAIISVFPAVAALRPALTGFFGLILFERPLVQIPACMVLALAIYALNWPVFSRKAL